MLITILSNHVIPNLYDTVCIFRYGYCSTTLGIADGLTFELVGLWNNFMNQEQVLPLSRVFIYSFYLIMLSLILYDTVCIFRYSYIVVPLGITDCLTLEPIGHSDTFIYWEYYLLPTRISSTLSHNISSLNVESVRGLRTTYQF